MNNEIKEILNYLTKFINDKEEITKYGCEISVKQAKLLYNYITNLQEEVKSSNESIIWWQNRFNALQKENERLKKLCDEYEEEHSNEFQYWKRDRKELLDKRTRNEKAIEFIEHENFKRTLLGFSENKYLKNIQKELLNILGGDDTEKGSE